MNHSNLSKGSASDRPAFPESSRRISAVVYADLVGKPFAHGARGPEAYDCVGLALALLARLDFRAAGLELASDERELHRQIAAGGLLAEESRVATAEPGAVVLLRGLLGATFHIGVMLDPYHMLHASEPAGSVVHENLLRSRWGRQLVAFYRPSFRGQG